MRVPLQESLSGLRDVEGVYGSFVLDGAGKLIDKDLPAVFDEGVFAEVGPRVTRLAEALSIGDSRPTSTIVKFGDYRLYLRDLEVRALEQEGQPRDLGLGTIGILAAADANMPTLTMATSVVVRRVASALNAALSEPRPTLTSPRFTPDGPDTVRSSSPSPAPSAPAGRFDVGIAAPTSPSFAPPAEIWAQASTLAPQTANNGAPQSVPAAKTAEKAAELSKGPPEAKGQRRSERPVYFRGRRIG